MDIIQFQSDKSFIFRDTIAKANILRRILTSEIPVPAITKVYIRQNRSDTHVIPFHDEYLEQRLEMMPVIASDLSPTTVHTFKFLRTNNTDDVLDIMSEELISSTAKLQPGILLTRLVPNQTLEIEAEAGIDTGKTHCKHKACVVEFKIDESKKEVHFNIESVCSLREEDILEKGLELYIEKLLKQKKEKKKSISENILTDEDLI